MKALLSCLMVLATACVAGPPAVYFADAFGPGRIFGLGKGTVGTYYARVKGQIASLATAPDGTVYFAEGSGSELYKMERGEDALVYKHNTYLRDVAVDSRGKVYFSEASGAGSDGVIYRLDGSQAVVFYRVPLSQVNGFWTGTFAFDPNDGLWLSSGNRVPASLYRVVNEVPQRVYTASDGAIVGFFFEGKDSLLYADFGQRIYRLTIPAYQRTVFYSSPTAKALSAVAPARQ